MISRKIRAIVDVNAFSTTSSYESETCSVIGLDLYQQVLSELTDSYSLQMVITRSKALRMVS